MPHRIPGVLPVLALLGAVTLALAGVRSESYLLPSHAGVPAIGSKPAEMPCDECHFDDGRNNLNTPGGAVEILDLPAAYETGQTYTMRVRLHSDSTLAIPEREWGFQITAVRASDGEGCGTFLLPDPDTLMIVSGSEAPFLSRSYVEHTPLGTRDSLAGPVSWTFAWRAPDTPQGSVYFHCAGNAANGNDDPGGDFIFTAADTVLDLTTPAIRVTWGGLKSRYR